MKEIIILIVVSVGLAVYGPNIARELYSLVQEENNTDSAEPTVQMFSQEELAKYDGTEGSKGIYLSILGQVFDVTKGVKHYGPGGSYNIFVGRDASKSFITGDFEATSDGITSKELDDVLTLEADEILSLKEWTEFYAREYIRRGRVVGRYYDNRGRETEYHSKVMAKVDEALAKKRAAEEQKSKEIEFPPCNIEWKADVGTRVWCTNRSGGIERSWVGYPRKYFTPGVVDFRCACVHEKHLKSASIKEYDGCAVNSESCVYNLDA